MAAYQEERLRKVSWILGNQQTKAALRDIWRVFLHLETFPGQKLGYVWTVGWLPIPKSHKFGVKHLQHIGTQVDEILELFFLRKDKSYSGIGRNGMMEGHLWFQYDIPSWELPFPFLTCLSRCFSFSHAVGCVFFVPWKVIDNSKRLLCRITFWFLHLKVIYRSYNLVYKNLQGRHQKRFEWNTPACRKRKTSRKPRCNEAVGSNSLFFLWFGNWGWNAFDRSLGDFLGVL